MYASFSITPQLNLSYEVSATHVLPEESVSSHHQREDSLSAVLPRKQVRFAEEEQDVECENSKQNACQVTEPGSVVFVGPLNAYAVARSGVPIEFALSTRGKVRKLTREAKHSCQRAADRVKRSFDCVVKPISKLITSYRDRRLDIPVDGEPPLRKLSCVSLSQSL
jgi:hypothetical protein